MMAPNCLHFISNQFLSPKSSWKFEDYKNCKCSFSVQERIDQSKNCDVSTDVPVIQEVQNIFEDMYGNLKTESGLEEIMAAMKELVDQYVGNCKNGGFWRQYADKIMDRYNKNKIN